MASKRTTKCESTVEEFIFQQICQKLTTSDVKALVYTQCLQQYLHTCNAIDVLVKLEEERKFSKDDLDPLAKMLKKIDRRDLAKRVKKYVKKQKKGKGSPTPKTHTLKECQTDDLARMVELATIKTKIIWKEVQAKASELGNREVESSTADFIANSEQIRSLTSRPGSPDISVGDSSGSCRHSSSSDSDNGVEVKPLVAASLQLRRQSDAARKPKMGIACTDSFPESQAFSRQAQCSEEVLYSLPSQRGDASLNNASKIAPPVDDSQGKMVVGGNGATQPKRKPTVPPKQQLCVNSSKDQSSTTDSTEDTNIEDSGFEDARKFLKEPQGPTPLRVPPPKHRYTQLTTLQREKTSEYTKLSIKPADEPV